MSAAWPAGEERPAVVTHTYDPALPRFRNLCDAAPAEAEAVLRRFRAAGRAMKSDYMDRRRAAETWMLEKARRILGPTPLARPIYFFLGDFDDGRDAARPAALLLPLAAIPPDCVTFTLGDSLDGPPYRPLLTLRQLEAARLRGDLPPAGEAPGRFVEMQLWDDSPLAAWR